MDKPCTFCDRRMFEERLIAEDENFYFIATLGQITEGGYVLVVPKQHIECFGDVPQNKLRQVSVAVDRASLAIDLEYRSQHLIFEHGKIGQSIGHAHFHVLPIAKNLNIREQVRKDFPLAEIDQLQSSANFFARLSESDCKEPYLFWQEADGSSCVCWNPKAPSQYLRAVVASALGRPERADWRKMDPELDRRLWSGTVQKLKPYFQNPGGFFRIKSKRKD